jgi:hypothetical protein
VDTEDKYLINKNGERSPGFAVPENYFANFAHTLKARLEVVEELSEYPALLQHRNEEPFIVPEDYFELAAEQLQFTQLSKARDTNTFKIPESYFENASAKLLSRIAPESAYKTSERNPFEVQDGYFEKNAEELRNRLLTTREAKIIRLPSKKLWAAAAAVLLLAVFFSVYRTYFLQQPVDCGTIACVDRQDILNTNTVEGLESEELIELADPDKLEQRLLSPPARNEDSSKNNFDEYLETEDI